MSEGTNAGSDIDMVCVNLTWISSGVNEGKTPLLDIVKALGEYLTSTEDDVRLKGESDLLFAGSGGRG